MVPAGRRRRRDWTPESPERLYLLLSGHVRTPAAGVLRRTGPGLMAGRQPPTPDDSEGDAAPREVIERLESELALLQARYDRTAATNRSNAAELDRVRRELRALKRRRSVRYALALSARSARLASLARRVGPGIGRRVRRIRRRMIDRLRQRDLRATAAAETALVATLREGLPAATVTGGPLVSIVILNRDGRTHLARCLAALATTAYRDVEVIVVDNGSTDGSPELAESFDLPFPLQVIRNADEPVVLRGERPGRRGRVGPS